MIFIFTKQSLRSFVISVILSSSNKRFFLSITSIEERLANEFGGGTPSSVLVCSLNSLGIF